MTRATPALLSPVGRASGHRGGLHAYSPPFESSQDRTDDDRGLTNEFSTACPQHTER